MIPRGRLFTKYAAFIIALVSVALLASGGVSVYFSYRENQEHLVTLQREKALAAASRIGQYITDIEHQLGWTALPQVGAGANPVEQRRYEYLKLLRQAPAITEVAWIDASGREQLRVSRLAMDVVSSGTDFTQDPKFAAAKAGKTWYSSVYFRKETEPYMTISRPAGGAGGGITVAEVNLKFVWEVVSRIQIGKEGLAYVVNSDGTLIAHPDISLVLQKTDLSKLAQVAAAARDEDEGTPIARNVKGEQVLTAHAGIPTLNWTVFVELPLAEAFAPLYASILRIGLLLLAGLVLSIVASVYLARLMVNPIRSLQEGAARIGTGQLDQRIEVHTGDELETLSEQFNKMASDLKSFYAGLERKVEERTHELSEALEQQTATAEILRVISSSPTDTQPVFDSIVKSGIRLFNGQDVFLRLVKDDHTEVVASTEPALLGENLPTLLNDDRRPSARTILRREVVQIPDVLAEDWILETTKARAAARGNRALLYAPMLREGNAIGAIGVTRSTPGPFTDKEVALLKTFADQAVIAIENVRLFKELQARNAEVTEALEQQTVTADILKVISGSLTDTQPVFDAIVKSGVHLFGGLNVTLRLVRGDRVELVASTVPVPDDGGAAPFRSDDDRYVGGRTILRREVVHVADVFSEEWVGDGMKQLAAHRGYRAILSAPLLKDGSAIGLIAVTRATSGPFTDKQITLLKTFADQAVIAIENVRLFNETKEALEQQTVTADILKVISSSPTDTQPVFDAILENAMRLCDAHMAALRLHDGESLRRVAQRGVPPAFAKWINEEGDKYPSQGAILRLIAEKRPIHILDRRESEGYRNGQPNIVAMVELGGVRTFLAVPMLKEGQLMGAIVLFRPEVRAFTQKQIDLVSTFANQAVIAIENVRLFKEIQDKSRQLEVANKHKSDFLANMSHELRTPLNAIIGFSEALLEKMFGEMTAKQEDYLKDIHSSGRHLLSLINDILDLSKIEAGRMELDLAEFHLPSALENAITLVRERAHTHGIALKLKVEPELGEIRADERKFKQIVVNLLSNAVKFTPDGGRVEVDARRNGSSIEVSVKDTGVGIAPEDQEVVFEEFRQVGRDYTNKQEGTGLGLALTRRFVELHGGKISLESAPGKGSTFTFTLPLNGNKT